VRKGKAAHSTIWAALVITGTPEFSAKALIREIKGGSHPLIQSEQSSIFKPLAMCSLVEICGLPEAG
jgi:hypothetical protein